MNLLQESRRQSGDYWSFCKASTDTSLSPRFRIVSIMPGMEALRRKTYRNEERINRIAEFLSAKVLSFESFGNLFFDFTEEICFL